MAAESVAVSFKKILNILEYPYPVVVTGRSNQFFKKSNSLSLNQLKKP